MVQHLLLMMVAPPLLWLGWPLFPLLRGLPEPVRTYWVAPLLRSRRVAKRFRIAHASARGLADLRGGDVALARAARLRAGPQRTTVGTSSSTPASSPPRCCSGIPSCGRIRAGRAGRRGCCFRTCCWPTCRTRVLAAWLTFSPRVLYPHYAQVPRLGGISALDDQAAAGVLMWVPGSIAFLLPLFWIGVAYLLGTDRDGDSPQPSTFRNCSSD